MKKIDTLIFKKDYTLILITIILFAISAIIILSPESLAQIRLEALYLIFLIIMAFEGYIISFMIIHLIERKYNRINRIRTSSRIRRTRIGKPLEYLFFIFLFIATTFISTALVQSDPQKHITYYSLAVLFYSIAIFSGWGHYMKKLYD